MKFLELSSQLLRCLQDQAGTGGTGTNSCPQSQAPPERFHSCSASDSETQGRPAPQQPASKLNDACWPPNRTLDCHLPQKLSQSVYKSSIFAIKNYNKNMKKLSKIIKDLFDNNRAPPCVHQPENPVEKVWCSDSGFLSMYMLSSFSAYSKKSIIFRWPHHWLDVIYVSLKMHKCLPT